MILICNVVTSSITVSQEDYNHPELDWKTIETEHFLVHFHNGAERTGREVATIAESVYGPVTSMYDHEPDQKVSFIIRDHDDYSNGGAYFFDNKIVIYAPALDFELRGTHPWLWSVVTHEFTHIIQIQTTMKFGRKVPGFYFQWLGYEKESRPDVLYGYPNVIVSYPLAGFVIPPWFAEGVAQYSNPDLGYDTWDSHRDMILRMYMIDGNPLTWNEMAFFGKNSLGNESVYNAGFSLVGYIGQKYGPDKLQAISRQLSAPFRITIDGALEAVLGKTGNQLYEEWKTEKTTVYRHLADSLNPTRKDGEIIEKEGFGNFYPVFSPDGSKIAYVSNKETDRWGSRIYLYDVATKTSKLMLPEAPSSLIRSSLSFSPDNKCIYYAQITRENPHWSGYSDLFRFDFSKEKEERLTYGLRAMNPKFSVDGKKLVFTTDGDGTLNIGVCDADGKNITRLTHFQNGEQVYTPGWSKDSKTIAFGYSTAHNQSIALIDSNGNNFRELIHTGDCRNPFFASDTTLFYSWDRGGIFNIYSLDLRTKSEQQITNVLGSAFLPTVNNKGDVAYVTYTSSGYKIALLRQDMTSVPVPLVSGKDTAGESFNTQISYRRIIEMKQGEEASPARSVHSLSENKSMLQARPYRSVFTSLSIIPLLRIDTYNKNSSGLDVVKPGFYFTSSDVLDKLSIFGGADINRKLERDLFLVLQYSGRLPILYQLGLDPTASLEVYNITRTRNVSFSFPGNPDPLYFDADVTYNLSEFDFSLKQKMFSEYCDVKLNYSLSRFSQDFGSWFYQIPGDPKNNQVIPGTGSTYFIGNSFSLQLRYDGILPSLDKDINPVGRSFSMKYFLEMDKFNPTDSTSTSGGFRVPVYTKYNISRFELAWNEHLALPFPRHTISFTVNASGILGPPLDEFFDYYAGGFIGMRGYSFYALGGNKTVTLNATYRFPIATQLDFRVLQIYFSKLYGSVFYDIGNAWPRETASDNFWKQDAGFELRLETFSFYAYPTRIFFSGAYGLDQFSRNVQDINTTTVTYGHEWRFYLGVLFGFELNDIMPRQLMR
ncbi:MAG: biopolymer transporter Tol [Ignavibacteriales bacterium]|nr:biopolymer transporter Tol [Ignavibacteriales bacterium]